jgi:zinc transport system ATP-binding protein
MPADAEVLAEASGVTFGLGGDSILSEVALTVRRGEIVTLIGPNGSGKSTLVRILLGLIAPDSGTIHRRNGLRIGYMPQAMVVDSSMPLTVGRFLVLGADTRRGRQRDAIAAVLDEVGAGALAEHPIQRISGGEMRRVLLARALLREPDLLVLDEPVSGVDIAGQGELYALIRRIRDERGCGVLMVSHDLHLVMAATDTVICLNHHVCCTGHPETVTRHPAYLALFGPLAERGLAVYTHHHDHGHDASGEVVPLTPDEAARTPGHQGHG